ncbi:MoaD/ThiS family protein [Niabella insulamsoli]|uniref:MoaD/ThiS family protein n=1 Tax=Niabella insulamsoli TaxID=3144874 RepID=UPI0031FD93DD
MPINVLFFGPLAEIGGSRIEMPLVASVLELEAVLYEKFPQLKEKKYVVSVNKKMIAENAQLHDGCTVALLPPFSGG